MADNNSKGNGSEETTDNGSESTNPPELDVVREVLESAGLTAQPLKNLPGYTIDFMDDGPSVGGVALVLADESRFVFFLEFLERGPEAHRAHVAEFLARVNYTITVGSFDLNYDTVQVRFRVSFDYNGDELRDTYVRSAILGAMNAVETYADLLFAVMKGEMSAKDAAEEGLARADAPEESEE
jgi:hypothetical protein